jgi:hypothetical protein
MKYLLCLLLFLTGCSYTRTIGEVGSKRFIKVQLGSLTAPGQTLLVIEDVKNGEITFMTPMAGNGVVPALLQAGGIAGGAVALGNVLEADRTTVTITDDPPAPPVNPPKTRPPANRPPQHKWK